MATDREREMRERRDAELGATLLAWAQAAGVEVEGPLDAPGMDPRWIARFRSEGFEADLLIFYGPHVDVAAFRPTNPDLGYFVGSEDGITDERLLELLTDLDSATDGGPDPAWLRLIEI